MDRGRPGRLIPGVSIRTARATDVDAVVALVESAYRGDSSRAGWTTEADLLDGQRTDGAEVSSLIARPGAVMVVAEAAESNGHQGHGFLGCFYLARSTPEIAYFGMFAVDPAIQGGGLGRMLIDEARRRAGAWGCSRLRMTVIRQRSELLAWYARLGFVPTGETEPFPYGDERFGSPRRDDLEFVVLEGATSTG